MARKQASEYPPEVLELFDGYVHNAVSRRDFLAQAAKYAIGGMTALAMLESLQPNFAWAEQVPQDDKRIATETITYPSPKGNGEMKGYLARPADAKGKVPAVVVIHENRGLNDHIRDVARRLGVAGFRAVAPDFLSTSGGTPADEDAAREAIGKLDLGKSVSDAVAILDELAKSSRGGKVGAVGFCWGGGFVNSLAVAAGDKLDAGVSYYGPAPDASEAAKVQAPLLIHDAGLDDRVNRTSFPWVEALRAAGKPVKFYLYEGVNHAFNNDTSAERYDKAAADLAWKRTLEFFRKNLGA